MRLVVQDVFVKLTNSDRTLQLQQMVHIQWTIRKSDITPDTKPISNEGEVLLDGTDSFQMLGDTITFNGVDSTGKCW